MTVVAVQRGSYLTDGHRLVWVRRVVNAETTVEECGGYAADERPAITVLTVAEMADWREVDPRAWEGDPDG